MSLRFLLFCALVPAALSGGLDPRIPLADPLTWTSGWGAAPVAGNDNGEFLTGGRRITSDGVLVDQERLLNTNGIPVGWGNAWLVISQDEGSVVISRVPARGPLEPFLTIPSIGALAAAATNDMRAAVLEWRPTQYPRELWVTVLDASGIVQRRLITRADHGAIAAFGDGFLVATAIRTAQSTSVVHVWKLDRDGTPLEVEQVMTTGAYPVMTIASDADRAAVVARRSHPGFTVTVVDADLSFSEPHRVDGDPGSEGFGPTPVATNRGFEVYFQRGLEGRVLELDSKGVVLGESSADPIGYLARSGNRYLVARPWGDIAVAEGTPRNLVSDPHLIRSRRLLVSERVLETSVSGNVSLIVFSSTDGRSRFVRVDETGAILDDPAQPAPSAAVAATPDGFAFVWPANGNILLQRLSRRGGWLDDEPLTLTRDPGALALSVATGESKLLVAWARRGELAWMRVGFDGTPADPEPRSVSIRSLNSYSSVGIGSHGDEWLISAQEYIPCNLSPCFIGEHGVHVLAVERDGTAPGSAAYALASQSAPHAVRVPDGSWVLPVSWDRVELVQFARDGRLLARIPMPELYSVPTDLASTPDGWIAAFERPAVLIRFSSVATLASIQGLEEVRMPSFAAGGWIAFLDRDPSLESATRPWIGRLAGVAGDLSLQVTDVTRSDLPVRYEIVIRNEGTETATGVKLIAGPRLEVAIPRLETATELRTGFQLFTWQLPPLAPGGELRLRALVRNPTGSDVRIMVVSDDTEDIRPEDNFRSVVPAAAAPSRRSRGTRPPAP